MSAVAMGAAIKGQIKEDETMDLKALNLLGGDQVGLWALPKVFTRLTSALTTGLNKREVTDPLESGRGKGEVLPPVFCAFLGDIPRIITHGQAAVPDDEPNEEDPLAEFTLSYGGWKRQGTCSGGTTLPGGNGQ